MKRLLIINLLLALFAATTAQAQEKTCDQLLLDYRYYISQQSLADIAATLQQGVNQKCSQLEYKVAKNHFNNKDIKNYMKYLLLAAEHGEKLAQCDLLKMYQQGTITTAPPITQAECRWQPQTEVYTPPQTQPAEHPVWTPKERQRIWDENNTEAPDFDAPFDYNKIDFERIDKGWAYRKAGIGVLIGGLTGLVAGAVISGVGHDSGLFYAGIGVMSASGILAITGAPLLCNSRRFYRQGGVKILETAREVSDGTIFTTRRSFPPRPGYIVRHNHYVKIKNGPHALLTPTFGRDFKGLSLVATW